MTDIGYGVRVDLAAVIAAYPDVIKTRTMKMGSEETEVKITAVRLVLELSSGSKFFIPEQYEENLADLLGLDVMVAEIRKARSEIRP